MKNIEIKNASLHNLKNISLDIPQNKLIVVTGLSGSGKSTLAFDTLYAEGQRRYIESLSSYARQFLGKLSKPQVESIKNLSPAIAIQQKVNTTNPRSTLGTTTEIYDYLKLVFARIGDIYSPNTGKKVIKHQVKDVVDYIKSNAEGEKMMLLAPIILRNERALEEQLNIYLQQGFSRIYMNKKVHSLADELTETLKKNEKAYLIIDRFKVSDREDFQNRISDSVQIAFYEGLGTCEVQHLETEKKQSFSNNFSEDGVEFVEPTVPLFSFNNPYGACSKCEGFGAMMGIDPDLVIPNKQKTLMEDAIVCWKTDGAKMWKDSLFENAYDLDISLYKPIHEFSKEQLELLWNGKGVFKGIQDFFKQVEKKSYKIQNRVLLSRYRGKTKCDECNGSKLRKEASYIKVGGKTITDLIDIPIQEVLDFIKNLKLNSIQEEIAKRIRIEITSRLEFLINVGLNYLTLNRLSATLSGGESQRINLATSLGSSLVGSTYILDEPSIGLHSKDTEKLIDVLKKLRDLGNTVIVVEHDEDIIKEADFIIDIGPEAGALGGELVFNGTFKELKKSKTLTADYIFGRQEIEIPKYRRKPKDWITVEGARENNLQNITVDFPLNTLTVLTGVSGSGKSTLLKKILYPALEKHLGGYGEKTGEHDKISGALNQVAQIEYVSQNPIGKSSRSNPVTYLKAYDDIRALFSNDKVAKLRGYKPKHFSFNVDGGRCEKCKGEGIETIQMQFMADVHITCEHCKGERFKREVLEIKFEGKNISDILKMTVDEAIDFFEEKNQTTVLNKIKELQNVGLGYVQLGQSSNTLSGGEAQRIKLASFLVKGNKHQKTLFIFDEPSTGLHFHDIKKLLKSMNALIENGHTVFVIEHHLDIIKSADYMIDLGLEGGDKGGHIIAKGTPEEVAEVKESHTAKYLKEKINN